MLCVACIVPSGVHWSAVVKELVATVTERGQVTIPAEVRRRLGLRAHDKVIFSIEDDKIELRPLRFTLESAFGAVKSLRPDLSLDEQIREAKEERAARTVRELGSV